MSDSPNLSLPYIEAAQAQKHVTHNEALQTLDGLVQMVLDGVNADTPPASPSTGDLYAVGSSPTGDWSGQAGKLALRLDGTWQFISPAEGWRAWDITDGKHLAYTSSGGWAEVVPDLDNLDGVGIQTSWDTTNRLAVNSPASLFTNSGGSHQIKVNKAADTDTASLLFQSNWTGHAEMGLAGDTAFSIKVSDDGATWHDAIKADAAAEKITFSMLVEGSAVQASATDTTTGRLMRADYGYSPGNLLGTVSESGGVPTGAVIERGSNATGEYVRFADGTQICWLYAVPVDVTTSGTQTSLWPATFSDTPIASWQARVNDPHVSLRYPNIRLVRSTALKAVIRLISAGTSVDPNSDDEKLDFIGIGRWF